MQLSIDNGNGDYDHDAERLTFTFSEPVNNLSTLSDFKNSIGSGADGETDLGLKDNDSFQPINTIEYHLYEMGSDDMIPQGTTFNAKESTTVEDDAGNKLEDNSNPPSI